MRWLLLLLLAPFSVHAACTPAPCLTVSWSAPTTNADGSAIATGTVLTYNVYAAPQGQALVKKTPTPISALSSVRTDVSYGTTYCYAITALATLNGVTSVESVQTAPVCGTPLAPIPPTPAAPGNVQLASVQAADTNAYKRRETVGGYSWVVYGTVTVGTVCDASHQDDGYQLVPRSAVTLTNRFDTHPLNEWARCS